MESHQLLDAVKGILSHLEHSKMDLKLSVGDVVYVPGLGDCDVTEDHCGYEWVDVKQGHAPVERERQYRVRKSTITIIKLSREPQ